MAGGRTKGSTRSRPSRVEEVFADSPVPFGLVDGDGCCTYGNSSLHESFGLDVGGSLRQILFPEPPLTAEQLWQVCRVFGGFRGNVRVRPIGKRRTLAVDMTLFPTAGKKLATPSFAVLLVPSIDHGELDRDRWDWQARFELALRVSGEGILDWDLERKVAFFSSRFRQIVGAKSRNLAVTGWQRRIHPDDRPIVREAIARHLADSLTPLEMEHRIVRSDGAERIVALRGQAIRDASGKPYRLIAALEDLTEQRHTEMNARRQVIELAHVQRLSTAGEFAAGIAHELNQPLAAITNFLAGARLRWEKGAPISELIAVFDRVAEQAHRAGEIVQRLRGYIRPNPSERAPISAVQIVREVAALVEPEARYAGIELRIETEGDPSLHADPIQIEQVLINLIRNSMDAVRSLPSASRQILLSLREDSRFIEFRVTDDGPGPSPEIVPRLFEPFVTSKQGGLGIGLSLSRSIVEAHGGTISLVRSDEGPTVATVQLPAGEGTETSQTSHSVRSSETRNIG